MKQPKRKAPKAQLLRTNFGVMNCTPKTPEGETQPRSLEHVHGYTKRHGNRTSNPLSTDKK